MRVFHELPARSVVVTDCTDRLAMPVGELRMPDDVFGRLRLWLRVLSVCLSELT